MQSTYKLMGLISQAHKLAGIYIIQGPQKIMIMHVSVNDMQLQQAAEYS